MKRFIKIPVFETANLPNDEVAVFYNEQGDYLELPLALVERLNDFVFIEEEVEYLEPSPPPKETPAEERSRIIREVQARVRGEKPPQSEYVAIPSHRAPRTEKDRYGQEQPIEDPADDFLARMNISREPPPEETNPIMAVGEAAGRDGNNLSAGDLKGLVDTLHDRKQSDYVKGQAFDKLIAVPMKVLWKIVPFTSVGDRRQIAAARTLLIDVATDTVKAMPQDLAAFIAGNMSGTTVQTEDRKSLMTIPLEDGESGLGDLFEIPTDTTPPAAKAIEGVDTRRLSGAKPAASNASLEARAKARAPQTQHVGLVPKRK